MKMFVKDIELVAFSSLFESSLRDDMEVMVKNVCHEAANAVSWRIR